MVLEGPGPIQTTCTKVIAYATVVEEMVPLLPPNARSEPLLEGNAVFERRWKYV
jgi:hypothetical protein